ncbi:MAG: hypothetical protein IJH47_08040 [Oscillospiraceae bacterium]|nr:hypothetical protein [Oscillospiraceae bacterium]
MNADIAPVYLHNGSAKRCSMGGRAIYTPRCPPGHSGVTVAEQAQVDRTNGDIGKRRQQLNAIRNTEEPLEDNGTSANIV